MFTLIRPLSAVVLAVFAYFAARAYEPLFDPQADLGNFPLWAAGVSLVVGWTFLGARIGRPAWMSVFAALQAVVLSALSVAMVLAVREVFILGYHRRYHEPMEAVTGYFQIVVNWLGKAMERDYLIMLGIGGVVIGVVLFVSWEMMEGRRNDR